jgi:hypothetical protein
VTDYTWPTSLVPNASEWRLIANTAAFVSPLTGATRTLARGGDRWACTLTLHNLTDDNRADLKAFLAKLRGQAHRVVIGDHSYTRRGTQSANVLVNGASQTGSSLIIDGGSGSSTFKAGDLVTVDGYLHMITADVTLSGGAGTISIVPPLRSSPANNATVTVTAPTARFLLANNTVSWSNVPGGFSSFTVELIEDIA